MCGRASQYGEFSEIERRFGPFVRRAVGDTPARYNAAPRQNLLVVRQDQDAGGRVVEAMRWGLIPAWAKTAKLGNRSVNARDIGEDGRSLEDRPMFRDAWRAGQRCLVPLNSFFEWQTAGKAKQPFAIGLKDGALMGVAGLWEPWRNPDNGEVLRSFTIITTAANATLAPLHDRMPGIIAPEDFGTWLTGDPAGAPTLLRPCPPDWLRLWPVTPRINKIGDLDSPTCVAPRRGAGSREILTNRNEASP